MRFDFIDGHRGRWPVRLMCRVLEVSDSGFYLWKKRPSSARKQRQMELTKKIKTAHERSRCTYGSPRVSAQLLAEGESVSVNTDFGELPSV